MAEKLYYSMGEVAEMFDVRPSLLRHWESQFGVLKPKRNKKGNRLFTPADIENLKLIYHLVKEQGMTLEGARKALRQCRREKEVPRDVELLERLQRIRALLVEVREELKELPPRRGGPCWSIRRSTLRRSFRPMPQRWRTGRPPKKRLRSRMLRLPQRLEPPPRPKLPPRSAAGAPNRW